MTGALLAAQAAPGFGSGLGGLLPLILIFVIMYFFMIRPQQKKMREHREMIAALRRGDQIVTQGGLIGKITKVIDDTEVEVEISKGVTVKVLRPTISQLLNKTEPANS